MRTLNMGLILAITGAVMTRTCRGGITFADTMRSPDNAVTCTFVMQDGKPAYGVSVGTHAVLWNSQLGLVRDDGDFTQGMTLLSQSRAVVDESYELLTGKRRLNHYRASEETYHLRNAAGQPIDIIFRVSNDGVAFRYRFPDASSAVHKITAEASSFHFPPENTLAWLQPMQVAKSGWQSSNPAYEEFYQKELSLRGPTTGPATGPATGVLPKDLGAGWVYPALFKVDGDWVALTEAGLGRKYCATHLKMVASSEFQVALADVREVKDGGPALPESTLPWETPWRVIAVGSLGTLVESTLGTDLADKPAPDVSAAAKEFAKPGKASWSWPLMGDKNTTFEVQKKFIDYAAEMGWGYCLIDALWDTQIGYERVKELCDYGKSKGVGILLWYNSAGDWNTTPQTPRGKLLTHEARVAEFERIRDMGVKGIKVDFFGGDGQSMIGYYQDILEDAAAFKLMVNFHGATLPRGWERTYPQLMTMEAVRGFEYITFEQANADQEPTHAAMLPFTRNLFDPMDFTPVSLDAINSKVQRRTSAVFELALSVLFVSGIQHYVETPEGMARQSEEVRRFLKGVPSVWEETKFIDGYPGKYVVIARKGGGKWYVAGINGQETAQKVSVDPALLKEFGKGVVIRDGANTPKYVHVDVGPGQTSLEETMGGHEGFVGVFEGLR